MLSRGLYKFIILSFLSLFVFNCGTEEEVKPDALSLKISSNEVFVGDNISFTANSQNKGDVTKDAEFFVNGNAISGSNFTPTEENENNAVYAKWNKLTSNTLNFVSKKEIVLPNTYTQKVLVEDYTGTWCGNCPGMNNVMNHLVEYSSNVIPVAIHCNNDPFKYEFHTQLQQVYNTNGLPKAQINRINPLKLFSENHVIDRCGTKKSYYHDLIKPYLDKTPPLGLAINSSLDGNKLKFGVTVGFLVDNISNAKLVVYLLEDKLIADQKNYFSGNGNADCNYSSQPHPIKDFEHNHVLQKAFTDIFGDEIPASEIGNGKYYQKTFNVDLPSNVKNKNNLSLVAFVMGNDNKEVINVQFAKVGEDKNFD